MDSGEQEKHTEGKSLKDTIQCLLEVCIVSNKYLTGNQILFEVFEKAHGSVFCFVFF